MNGVLVAFGAFVGITGMIIAVWLELLSNKRVPFQYITGFFIAGAVMFLLHSGSAGLLPEPVAEPAVAVALTMALMAELYGAWWVYTQSPDAPTAKDVASSISPGSGR